MLGQSLKKIRIVIMISNFINCKLIHIAEQILFVFSLSTKVPYLLINLDESRSCLFLKIVIITKKGNIESQIDNIIDMMDAVISPEKANNN